MSHFKASSIRKEKMAQKDTRWDRIRKRNVMDVANTSLKSDAVRRLIETDFIGRHNQRMLLGDKEGFQLSPSVVMDIRHEMVSKRFFFFLQLLVIHIYMRVIHEKLKNMVKI